MAVLPKHIRDGRKAEAEAIRNRNLELQEPLLKGAIGYTNGRNFSTGYRMSPSPKVSHKFSEHPGRGAGIRADRIKTLAEVFSFAGREATTNRVSHADKALTGKQLRTKYAVSHNELYEGAKTKPEGDNECRVRVGTTPSHGLMIEDKETGERKFIKVPAKAKWAIVGNGAVPKDGVSHE